MATDTPVPLTSLTRALCIVVFIVMTAAVVYTAWVGVSNFHRIHV